MTSNKYNSVKKAILTGAIALLPVIGYSQEKKSYIKGETKDPCENIYNPKTEGVHKKSDALKWRTEYRNWKKESIETISEKDSTINSLEKRLSGMKQDKKVKNNITNYNIDVDNTYITINKIDSKKGPGARLLIEANKDLENDIYGANLSGQVRVAGNNKTGLWFGAYAGAKCGKTTNEISTDVYNKTLLDQKSQMFVESEGKRTSSMEKTNPYNFGLNTSLDLGAVRFTANVGLENQATKETNIIEAGNDNIIYDGKTIDSKPYSFELENGKAVEELIPKIGVSIDITPFKKSGFYFGVSAEQNFKDKKIDISKTNFGAKIGWRIGGRRK